MGKVHKHGMVVYDDTADSYTAGFSTARRDVLGMTNDEYRRIVGVLRKYLNAESTNKYALAYAEGALDALAPVGLYA
jgi:hypothetical protein